MHIVKEQKFTGVDFVIPAIEKNIIRKLVGSQLYNGRAIKRKASVNCADSKHNSRVNWMYFLLMGICVIQQPVT